MGFLSVLSFAQKLIAERVQPGETVVDATVGNGVDTLFLARTVGGEGKVYGFDIQPQALRNATERLSRELAGIRNIELLLASHEFMLDYLPREMLGRTGAVMFNLGYLPGSDHATITRPYSTLPALNASLELLRPGGVLTVVVYTGHEGGQEEADAVQNWIAKLPQDRYQSMIYRFLNQKNAPPYLLAVEKR